MSDHNYRTRRDFSLDYDYEAEHLDRGTSPGKVPTTARLSPRQQTNIVFRVADASTAAALSSALGPRNSNGVAEGASHAVERATSSAGQPLPGELRDRFEGSLGVDLSSVRIHTGADSARASKALGARAYTMGQDIHFNQGQYDPVDPFGVHLLAHEVAHTVQQAGSAASVQEKLEVSAPGDSLEREADRAADAMVAGEAAAVSAAAAISRQVIQREPEGQPADKGGDKSDEKDESEADKEWAKEARTTIRSLETAVSVIGALLDTSCNLAIGQYQAVNITLSNFENKYKAALQEFAQGVNDASAATEANRKAFDMVLDMALGSAAPVLAGGISAASGVLGKIQTTAGFFVNGAPAGAKPAEAPTGDPTAPGAGAGIDWSGFVDQILQSYQSSVQSNSELRGIGTSLDKHEAFLSSVIEGSVTNGRESAGGKEVDKIMGSLEQISASLGGCGGSELVTAASATLIDVTSKLGKVTPRKLKQDIAIRWMASKGGPKNLDDIDKAATYLKSLGVFDRNENRLGYDPGVWIHGSDEVILQARAAVESEAMQLVGKTGEWLGGTRSGQADRFTGSVRANGRHYKASGHGLVAGGGGSVTITAYSIAPIPDNINDWSRPANTKQILAGLVSLSVTPNGTMGGGATPDGPSAGQR